MSEVTITVEKHACWISYSQETLDRIREDTWPSREELDEAGAAVIASAEAGQ